jgi:hypothetical protein
VEKILTRYTPNPTTGDSIQECEEGKVPGRREEANQLGNIVD